MKNFLKEKFAKKEVKKMKKICILTLGILLLLGMHAYAEDATIVSTSQKQDSTIEIYYNAFGVVLNSTQVTTSVTTSVDSNGATAKTTTVSTAESSWKGGSVKVDEVTGTSDMTSTDGASSHTVFSTDYNYNTAGQLSGASGTANTTGNRGKDANGQAIGTYTSNTVDNYVIKNGQAIRTGSVATGTNYGPDGKKTSSFTETTTYSYELIAGSWHLTKEINHSVENGVDGSVTDITKTKVYTRNSNGVCTSISQTATGTQKTITETGGTQTSNMKNYIAQFSFSDSMGWYLAKESYQWDGQVITASGGGTTVSYSGSSSSGSTSTQTTSSVTTPSSSYIVDPTGENRIIPF